MEYDFEITDNFEDIEFSEEQKKLLNEPSGLTEVLMLSNWLKVKYRIVDFTKTTNAEAIKKILAFYKHKTILRCVQEGDTRVVGFGKNSKGATFLDLSSYPYWFKTKRTLFD
jgi:hypothetical protein